MARNPNAGTADIFLEYGGVKMPYRLAHTQSGNLAWRQAWSPMLPEEQRTAGPFSAQQYPAAIDIPLSFDDWSGGCGYTETVDADGAPRRYNYSRGIDASHPQRLYLSPALQTPVTDISVAPTWFSDTSAGFFATVGRYIYEWTVSSADWTQRHDLGAGEAFTGPVVEFNGVNCAPAGDAKAYVTSTDGVTWTASTLADPYAHKFVTRGRTTTTPIIWKISAVGAAKNTYDPTNAGPAWSGATPLGHTSETINSFLNVDDDLRAFKVEGIISFDGTNVIDTWVGGRNMKRSGNGKNAFQWGDGAVYVPYGDRLLRYDPLQNAGAGSLDWVLPLKEWLGNIELNGQITAVSGDADWLYIALKNSAGNSYILKGVPGGAWHTFVYLGANDCNALFVAGPGVVHSTNPVIMLGYGSATRYIILCRSGLRPEDDTNYRFTTTTGYLYGPWCNVGSKSFKKFLSGARIIAENCSAGKPITLGYERNADETATTAHTARSNGLTNSTISAGTEYFYRVRPYITMLTDDNTTSPRGLGFMFNNVLTPPRKKVWTATVICGDHQLQSGGGMMYVGERDQESFLFRSSQEHATLYDRSGRSFHVRVLDVAEPDGARPESEADAHAFTVTMVEIHETTEETNVGIWDQDAWDTNKVWGA